MSIFRMWSFCRYMDELFVHPQKFQIHLVKRMDKQFVHVATKAPRSENRQLWPLDSEKWMKHPCFVCFEAATWSNCMSVLQTLLDNLTVSKT